MAAAKRESSLVGRAGVAPQPEWGEEAGQWVLREGVARGIGETGLFEAFLLW
jgi:hypothetical protein